MKNNKEITQHEISRFASHFCPFKLGDIKAAISWAYEAGLDEYWVAKRVLEFADDVSAGNLSDIDPVYVVLDSILEEARNEISEVTESSFDILNDTEEQINIDGNYIASSFDYSDEAVSEIVIGLAQDNINIEELSEVTQFFLKEIGISQDDINDKYRQLLGSASEELN